jgi:hypothetical protein
MSDQCQHCTLRGDLAACQSTPCNQHESWMVQQLRQQCEDLLAATVEYIAAGDNSVNPKNDDDVAAMLRFREADKAVRAIVAKLGARHV